MSLECDLHQLEKAFDRFSEDILAAYRKDMQLPPIDRKTWKALGFDLEKYKPVIKYKYRESYDAEYLDKMREIMKKAGELFLISYNENGYEEGTAKTILVNLINEMKKTDTDKYGEEKIQSDNTGE